MYIYQFYFRTFIQWLQRPDMLRPSLSLKVWNRSPKDNCGRFLILIDHSLTVLCYCVYQRKCKFVQGEHKVFPWLQNAILRFLLKSSFFLISFINLEVKVPFLTLFNYQFIYFFVTIFCKYLTNEFWSLSSFFTKWPWKKNNFFRSWTVTF